jgi:hypothetical protein
MLFWGSNVAKPLVSRIMLGRMLIEQGVLWHDGHGTVPAAAESRSYMFGVCKL